MKKIFFIVVCNIVYTIQCYALYVEINLSTPNTLSENVASSKKYLIDSLKVIGDISGNDIKFIRDLCGTSSTITGVDAYNAYGKCDQTEGQLTYLDLSMANFVTTKEWADYIRIVNTGYSASNLSVESNKVKRSMFMYCHKLKKIILPNNIESIESYAFAKCESLQEIIIPETVTLIRETAFDYCNSLLTLRIPDNCTDSYFGFIQCDALKSIYLGKSYNSDRTNFYNCKSLEMIYVSDENSCFSSIDGVLYTKDKTKIVSYPTGRSDDTYYVIDNVVSIGSSVFRNNKKLTNLHLPPSIANIGEYSFYGSSFSKIWLSATIPPSITNYSFGTNWEKDFRKSCVLYVPKGSYNSYWLAGGWGDFNSIKEFDGTDEILQCAAPQIVLENGELHFTSETDGVRFYYSIDDKDIISNKESSGIVYLNASYNISVYAVAEGFTRSQMSYATLYWLDGRIENTSKVETIQASKRAILISSHNGLISISGLNKNEDIAIYSTSGVLLWKGKSHNHTVSFNINTNEKILICKVSDECIKFVLK